MTDIIVKDVKNGSEYYYWGGASYTAGNGIDITNNEISVDTSTAPYDNTTSGMTATNVQDAIDEVFWSVSNGKTIIAAAITDMWVSTAASDSFATMATNIGLIGGGAQEIERNEYWYDLLQAGQWTLLYFSFDPSWAASTSKRYASSHSVWTEWYAFSTRDCGGYRYIICANESFQTTSLVSIDGSTAGITGVTLYEVEWEDDYIYISVSQGSGLTSPSWLRLTKSNFTIANITYDSSKTYTDISQWWPFILRAIWWQTQYSTIIGFVAKMS